MIFHAPYPLNPNATSASGIRPVRMLEAFRAAGFEVLTVTGSARERRVAMKQIEADVRNGKKIDFLYSEASTRPLTFSTSFRQPHPYLDTAFFRFCQRHDIPVGVFYRDIYWQFSDYVDAVGRPAAAVLRRAYRHELKGYRSSVSALYLPSMKMADSIPFIDRDRCIALPPGSESVESPAPDNELNILYVGGVGSYYRMHEAVIAVERTPDTSLIICTRESEWQAQAHSYEPHLEDSVTVVHESGAGLERLYGLISVGSLIVEPIGYREFAAPLKMYEYLGHGKPIIATTGTLAAEFVTSNGIGWAVDYNAEALAALFERLAAHPNEVAEKTARAREVRQQHTWLARALQVRDDLTAQKAKQR